MTHEGNAFARGSETSQKKKERVNRRNQIDWGGKTLEKAQVRKSRTSHSVSESAGFRPIRKGRKVCYYGSVFIIGGHRGWEKY